jgi:hypothetical protein
MLKLREYAFNRCWRKTFTVWVAAIIPGIDMGATVVGPYTLL